MMVGQLRVRRGRWKLLVGRVGKWNRRDWGEVSGDRAENEARSLLCRSHETCSSVERDNASCA